MVCEEADESAFWLELSRTLALGDRGEVERLLSEAGELTAIFTTSRDTPRNRLRSR
jgi:hypothetical protein